MNPDIKWDEDLYVTTYCNRKPGEILELPDNEDDINLLVAVKPNNLAYLFKKKTVTDAYYAWLIKIPENHEYRGKHRHIFRPTRVKFVKLSSYKELLTDINNMAGFVTDIEDGIIKLDVAPKNIITHSLAAKCIEYCKTSIRDIPEWILTDDLYIMAVKNSVLEISFIPPDHMTTELLVKLVDAMDVENVPDIYAFDTIDVKYKTHDFYDAVIRKGFGYIENVPIEYIDDEFANILVGLYGKGLQYIPADIQTDEMYRIVLAENGKELVNIPVERRDMALCELAIASNIYAFEYVPKHLRTRSLCRSVVKKCGTLLKLVPSQYIDAEICMMAVSSDGKALQYVPTKLLSKKLCMAAVNSNWESVIYVPPGRLEDKYLGRQIVANRQIITIIPNNILTNITFKLCIFLDSEFVPNRRKT